MFSLQPVTSRNAFYYSLALHLVLLTILVVSFDFSSQMPVVENSKNKEVINAIIMDRPPSHSKIIQKHIPPPKLAAQPQPKPEPKPIAPPLPKPVEPKPKIKQDLIQKQLLADLKKQTQQQKNIKQKAFQSAFEKEMNEIKEKSLEQQMLQEQKRLANVMDQQTRGIVDKYKALILQAISQHWNIPPNIDKHLTAELLIRVAPGGVVLEVQLIKSSGDERLDQSARAAIFKTSPLPVPTDSEAFQAFKQFVLKVKPENILSTDNVV